MNEIDEVMNNSDVLIDKIVNNLPELIILFTLVVIAIIANSIFKHKRKKREEKKQQELEIEMQHLQERKTAAIKTAHKKSTHISKPPSSSQRTFSHIPEDSTLRRHVLSQSHSMLNAIYGPQPTDSALFRHFQCLIHEKMQCCISDENFYLSLIEEYNRLPKPHAQTTKMASHSEDSFEAATESPINETLEQTATIPEAELIAPEPAATEPLIPKTTTKERPMIPQDSTLRRHFISNLRAIIEAEKSPQPTDNTLKRHFKGAVDSELENRLAQMQS